MGDHFGTIQHISVSIDGTSPDFFLVDSPSNALQTHKVSGPKSPRGRVGGQKGLKNPENPEKLSPGRGGGGTGVGDHFGTIRHISVSIGGTSPKLLW